MGNRIKGKKGREEGRMEGEWKKGKGMEREGEGKAMGKRREKEEVEREE